MNSMEALRFTPGSGLELIEVEVPSPGDGEVLIEVLGVGLCGTDASVVTGRRDLPAPVVLGHETAGTVVSVGREVPSARLGELVAVAPIVVCGRCGPCVSGTENLCADRSVIGIDRDGGLAEFVAVPSENALPLPGNIAPEVGAICVDAVATPYHALHARARLGNDESVAVLGVGGLGQHAVQLAAAMTKGSVIAVDVRQEQLDLALLLGASAVVDARSADIVSRLRAAAGGSLDVALDCAGVASTLNAALEALRPGGRAVRVALEHGAMQLDDPVGLVRAEMSLVGSYGFTRAEVAEVLGLVAQGRLDLSRSISHRVARSEVASVLRDMAEGAGHYRRVVVCNE